MSREWVLALKRELLSELLEIARVNHPREVVFLLRGEVIKVGESIRLLAKEYLVPPLWVRGYGYSSFNLSMLPFDESILATIHSHPSGSLKPSIQDLNSFVGRVIAIIAYPYISLSSVAAYDKNGSRIRVIEV